MQPLFSIIIVTRNAADVIDATLRSINDQTCTLYEVIVQDGASTDDTLERIKTVNLHNVSIVSEHDGGIYYGMNRALARAKGDYVLFLNAGDSFHSPGTLQLIADTVMDEDYPGIAYGRTNIIDADRNYLCPRHLEPPEVLSLEAFKEGMVVCHQAFVVLRKLTGPYDVKYRLSADYDWCIQCLQRSRRNKFIDAVLVDYLREGMTTRRRRRSLWERYRIMCRYYGTWSTTWRHLRFACRFLSHKRKGLQ